MSSTNTASSIEVPIAIRWKILKEELDLNSGEQNWSLYSDKFDLEQLPGVRYHLRMQQKNDCFGENVILGLTVSVGRYPKIKANFKLSIPSVNYYFHGENLFEKRQFAGNTFCTKNDLLNPSKTYFRNNYMIVKMEGLLTVEESDPDIIVMDVQMNSCSRGMKLWDRDDKDFAFIVGGREIRVHKLIVSAESPVFDRMIKSGMKESTENRVEIVDFDFEVVEMGVKFCYGIKEKNFSNLKIAFELLQFSEKYDIEDLKDAMETFLAAEISAMNVCEISNAAVLSNSPKLCEICFEYLLECTIPAFILRTHLHFTSLRFTSLFVLRIVK